jgi:putative restriction endonuclease
VGVIGDSIEDPTSDKNDWYCEILDYQEFEVAVPFKVSNDYLETIPENRQTNYWRYGVREVDQNTYERILDHAKLKDYEPSLPNPSGELESYQQIEGNKRARFSTYYERNPFYRNRAIEIHGFICMACGFDYEALYGELGKGYIQVHHNKPLSETGPTTINPETDLCVLCANCHVMLHRRKNETLSVDSIREIVQSNRR